jgi:hypothetical protein
MGQQTKFTDSQYVDMTESVSRTYTNIFITVYGTRTTTKATTAMMMIMMMMMMMTTTEAA